jgi:hypothetical protein
MNTPLLTFQLAANQVIAVHLSDPAERLTCENLAKYQLEIDQEKAELRKTYHLGDKPTRNRGYDDRLTVRLGPSRSTLLDALALWTQFNGKRGGLPNIRAGNKYWVSELACREWLGDLATHRNSLGGPGRWAVRRATGQDEGSTKL